MKLISCKANKKELAGLFCHPHGKQKGCYDPPHGEQNGHYGRRMENKRGVTTPKIRMS